AREMLAAARDFFLAQAVVERSGELIYLLDTCSIAAAAQRIIRVVVERNIEHRAEVEIESENAKESAGHATVAAHKLGVIFFPKLLRIRRLVADDFEPRDASAFLVDRDDRLDLAQVAEIVDELPQLRGRLDVADEKNE